MSFNLDEFKPLASVLLQQGAPLLARALLGPFGGMIAGAVVPSLVEAFGLPADASPADIATAASKDDSAADKLAAIQAQHQDLLDWAQKAMDANQAALAAEPSFWGRLYVGGWRPAMGWLGVAVIGREVGYYAMLKGPLPFETLSLIVGLWCGLAGIRSVEMVRGVARTALATVAKRAVR
ncbi:hypothetical protein SAMN06265338_11523 [Rhodoblastus acidophilus]|uniref:Holin of 3TMs, for gene-transfer release n=1 Tax=Rhodoblastus acidophilus TaxID=1074 RepID=A0A212S7S1_RHOAC|nr:hypothetical protein [Rhodoblastus acidophilus]PPQ37058.1 hypothetical protein CKO16_15830 [Rhodoblastus acidophilus]RAI20367.1 hypothetical protein CH337_10230 [Rhodoblastus acidophilus]SNB81355.1 hypothetical protein SAMN06265338_11523 [Rhodoblastus acidophilus]